MTEKSPAAAAAEKAKATSKAKAKPAAKAAPSKDDVILSIAKEVETASREIAVERVSALMEDVELNYFQIGGFLARIQDESWWSENGAKSFREYLEKELGFAYRKSMYLVQIYKNLVNAGVSWEHIKSIGWTKMKEISDLINSDNVEDWVAKAKDMTVLQLIAYVKSVKLGDSDPSEKGGKSEASHAITTMTFKLHPDQRDVVEQALDTAKNNHGTDVGTVALQKICETYLTDDAPAQMLEAPAASMEEFLTAATFKEIGYEKLFELIGEAFPELDVEVTV